jgi:hypothetical protein
VWVSHVRDQRTVLSSLLCEPFEQSAIYGVRALGLCMTTRPHNSSLGPSTSGFRFVFGKAGCTPKPSINLRRAPHADATVETSHG